MRNVSAVLIGLAAAGFLLAVVTELAGGRLIGVGPVGFSRGCTNLALIAIALAVTFREENKQA